MGKSQICWNPNLLFGSFEFGIMSDYWMFNLEWFDESYTFEGVTLFRTVILSLIILLVVYVQCLERSSVVVTKLGSF